MKLLAHVLFLVLAVAAFGIPNGQAGSDPPFVFSQPDPEVILWETDLPIASASLKVRGPNGFSLAQVFPAGEPVVFLAHDDGGVSLPDGSYQYELVGAPQLDDDVKKMLAEAGEDRAALVDLLRAKGKLPAEPWVQSGSVGILSGQFLNASKAEGQESEQGVKLAEKDQVIPDDLIVQSSICSGFDCVNNESFGADTIRLKENNLRIHFDDTSSTGSFPSNDWRIVANDQASGGASYLSFEDVTGSKVPFRVIAGAPTNSVYVNNSGNLGLGTSTPALDVQVQSGNTPAIRLDQDGSSGFTPQVWDVAGNEAGFFVRDLSAGSRLPFRILPGAPSNRLTVGGGDNDGVGLGTLSPRGAFEVANFNNPSASPALVVKADGRVGIGIADPLARLHVVSDDNTDILQLQDSGNVIVGRAISQACDVNLKENFELIDPVQALETVLDLPITEWSYKNEDGSVRHLSPMAQDFYAATGLGADDKHIAPIDLTGLALAAIQGLQAKLEERQSAVETSRSEIEALKARNSELESRLEALEKLLLPTRTVE